MKKILILCLVLALLVACAPKEAAIIPEPVDAAEPKVTEEPEPAAQPEPVAEPEPAAEPTTSPETAPESQVIVEPSPELDSEIAELLRRSQTKLKSIEFTYTEPPVITQPNAYRLRLDTDTIRVDLYRYDPYDITTYFDTIWINTDDDSSTGCCVERARCESKEVDRTGVVIENLTASDYLIDMPLDWLKRIPSDAEVVGTQTIMNRNVLLISYAVNGDDYHMWIDSTYGVPLRVFVYRDEEIIRRYLFSDVKFNTVDVADLTPVCV